MKQLIFLAVFLFPLVGRAERPPSEPLRSFETEPSRFEKDLEGLRTSIFSIGNYLAENQGPRQNFALADIAFATNDSKFREVRDELGQLYTFALNQARNNKPIYAADVIKAIHATEKKLEAFEGKLRSTGCLSAVGEVTQPGHSH